MIKLTLINKCDQIIGFEMTGHANYAEYGQDIVCAAASVLSINTINSIHAFTRDTFDYKVREDDGFLYFRLHSNAGEQSNLLLKAFKLGIESIEQQYGNSYININTKEV